MPEIYAKTARRTCTPAKDTPKRILQLGLAGFANRLELIPISTTNHSSETVSPKLDGKFLKYFQNIFRAKICPRNPGTRRRDRVETLPLDILRRWASSTPLFVGRAENEALSIYCFFCHPSSLETDGACAGACGWPFRNPSREPWTPSISDAGAFPSFSAERRVILAGRIVSYRSYARHAPTVHVYAAVPESRYRRVIQQVGLSVGQRVVFLNTARAEDNGRRIHAALERIVAPTDSGGSEDRQIKVSQRKIRRGFGPRRV